MFTTIRTAIKTKLDTLTGVGQPIAFVYDEHRTKLTGYPAITVEPSDMESDFATTIENQRTYIFRIIIHQEIEKVGRSKAIDILCNATDKVITTFDADITLGGAVNFLNATPSVWGEYGEGAGIVKYAEIMLRCNCLTTV